MSYRLVSASMKLNVHAAAIIICNNNMQLCVKLLLMHVVLPNFNFVLGARQNFEVHYLSTS